MDSSLSPLTRHGATILGGVAGPELMRDEAAFFREADPFGFILFARNVANPDQLRALTSDLREAVGRDAPVFVDQEGGRVQRLRPPHWTDFAAPLTRAAQGPRATWLHYRLLGAELRAVGIDANCAPTLDRLCDATHPFLRDRCFGSDPEAIAMHGRACADALLASGVLPVMKHLPGHGRATADSHHDLPVIDASPAELAPDLAPFRALADLPIAMTAHLRIPAIDPDAPITLSPAGIAFIRDVIGFTGLLTTDDITMEALPGSHAERAVAAIAAGCDVVMHCNGTIAQMEPVVAAAGRLAEAAAVRAGAALRLRHVPEPVVLDALRAELASLDAAAEAATG